MKNNKKSIFLRKVKFYDNQLILLHIKYKKEALLCINLILIARLLNIFYCILNVMAVL